MCSRNLFPFILVIHLSFAQLPSGQSFTSNQCAQYPAYQEWIFPSDTFSLYNYSKTCFDCAGCEKGAVPHTWSCDPSNPDTNQQFNIIDIGNGEVQLKSISQKTCVQSISDDPYSMILMQECDARNPLQKWRLNTPNPHYISSVSNSSLCLTAAYYAASNCSQAPFNTFPYCNAYLSTADRVKDLLSRMTIAEKITNLKNQNPGVARLGVPPNHFNEALHGVVVHTCGATYNGNTGCATSFPHATLLAASFNRTLWKHVATAISDEARALYNQNIAGTFFWAPDINLFRDPRWGRGQETPGEDPFLTGEYVAQYARYMQHGEDEKYLKVVATAKHYADYDQEGNYGINRGDFNAVVSDQDQVEYYWPQWRTAIQIGNIQSIMCSYNAVNGMPSCGNDYFMNEIAREQWGFDGFFVSDCGALSDPAFTRYINETYNGSNSQQARVAMEGGCDVECGNFYVASLPTAYQEGVVSQADIDQAAARLFTKTFELGIMDSPGPVYNGYGPDKVDSAAHRELALSAAQQGIILLKNEHDILPLKSSTKVAMIGPHANATQDMLSIYHGTNILVNSHSPYQAVMNRQISVTYAMGCNDIACNTTSGFAEAVDAAKTADVAVVFLGLHPGQRYTPAREDEGWDRENITFVGEQLTLLKQVMAVNAKTVLVLINGGAIDITWPKTYVPGIIEALYPGQLGGDAIASVLFGDVSPAGKLPITIYPSSLTVDRPTIMDMSLRDRGGITYRYYQGTPLYSFGFGLSYTTFAYKYYSNGNDECIDAAVIGDIKRDQVSDVNGFVIQVTNTGQMASDCVVLGFVTSDHEDAPKIKLFDFQRTFVEVGESKNVTLSISPYSISLTNKVGHERVVPGHYQLLLGDYQNDNFVKVDFCISGEDYSVFDLPDIQQRYHNKRQS